MQHCSLTHSDLGRYLFPLHRALSLVVITHLVLRVIQSSANTMAGKQTKFRVAAAHAAPVFMNKAATIRKTVVLIEQAAKEEIKLLVFPETFIPGYPVSELTWPPQRRLDPFKMSCAD